MKPLLRVIKKGIFSSIQDKGRFYFRSFGIPTAGPMDKLAYTFGQNILCNETNAAALEIFYGGMSFEGLAKHEYVLAGASMNASINGSRICNWKSFILQEGDILQLKFSNKGAISYLIPVGGFISKKILNSQSASVSAKIGIEINNETVLYGKNVSVLKNRRGLYDAYIPQIEKVPTIRVVPSYQITNFEESCVETFFSSNYQLTSGNRMGYFLDGPKMIQKQQLDILSEPTMFGTIQIPPKGQPIILMADAQTVGGYPTIGKVVDEDLWKVAQLRYGDEVKFIKENLYDDERTINN